MRRVDGYHALLHLLDAHGTPYELLEHAPAGQTAVASEQRRHALNVAAKCLVLELRGGESKKYVLAVIEGHRRVHLKAVRRLYGLSDAGLAPARVAEHFGRAVIGSIPPFSFDPHLEVVVDVRVLDHPAIYFNAARLDRSVALDVRSYLKVGNPRIARIAK